MTTSEDAVARLRAAIAKLEPGEDRPPTQDADFWVELLRVTLDGWAEALERDLRRADAALAAINKLKRDRMLTPGFAYRLRWRRNGEETGTAGLVCDSTMRIRLLYRLEGPYVGQIGLDGRELAEILEDRDLDDSWFFYPVWIVHTICHFGGWRPWFRCLAEGCGRRVGKLYLGNRHFFYRLRYACQREHEWDRLLRRREKLESRLAEDGWSRPTGMHRRTYDRLADELMSIEDRLGVAMIARWSPDLLPR